MKLKKTVHYYKFRDIMENPLLQEKLLNKKTVAGVLSTISRYSTITRYTITRVDCSRIGEIFFWKIDKRAGHNNRAGMIFFGKLISEQALITMSRVDFFKFINKRACSTIREVRVSKFHLKLEKRNTKVKTNWRALRNQQHQT